MELTGEQLPGPAKVIKIAHMTWLFNVPSCRSRESNFCQYVREGKDYQDGCKTNVLFSLNAVLTFLAQEWKEQLWFLYKCCLEYVWILYVKYICLRNMNLFNILRSGASLLYFASVLCPGMGQKSPHINRFVLCAREHYIGIGKNSTAHRFWWSTLYSCCNKFS